MRQGNKRVKSITAMLLAVVMLIGSVPAAMAAQSNEYVDPADKWLSASGRTNELDVNATVTYETSYCCVCEKYTTVLTYRVPEYTKSGQTALNRGVQYSDGTCMDGSSKGNLDEGTPGVNAYYTGYHWSKSVCQNCGTINSIDGSDWYNFNTNVYVLNSCASEFYLDFDNTEYETYNDEKHTTILKRGKYCQFCKGTQARAMRSLENHHFVESIDGQLGNNRFYITKHCEDCGYETSKYVAAKSVVSSYYGPVDDDAHTVTVSDLSESGVHTSIRYGTSAERCNLTSAPNYTEAGYYPVYYEIDYKYANKNMTENGVSYVWLHEKDGDTIIIVPPIGDKNEAHTHDYRYVETVPASCENLGYERWQCDSCGRLDKRNYTPATGHSYHAITIKEPTCKQGGQKLIMCSVCGDFYEETTSVGSHSYRIERHNPTCRSVGYTDHICTVCGDNYITDMQPIISHAYEHITKAPTCTDRGYTTHTCVMCGSSQVSDYTEPTGHEWDEGRPVTSATCEGDGVTEFHCLNCAEKMLKAESATGHTPGKAANCTEPQTCTKCGTVLELPTGHHYESAITNPTCTAMGYTVYTCLDCSDSYTGDYTDKTEHDYAVAVTEPSCTEHGFSTYTCRQCEDSYVSDYTDKMPHNYNAVLTAPTCTAMGYTVFTCTDCGDRYIGNYTDMTEHNYNKEIIAPTCTEHGYAVFTCPDCGKSFIGEYTDCIEHNYLETVVEPTCTEMGYTIFECEICGEEYKGEYVNATGHQPSGWIVDILATIEQAGEKHLECEACKMVLKTVAIPQLVGTDRTDEDGKAAVGNYNVTLTDQNGKPVFDAEIVIDTVDTISVTLPKDRILDYNDRTIITVTKTTDNVPASGLQIIVADERNNNATGITDNNGVLAVPGSSSSTGDNNGTIGTETEDAVKTYVITVTDKANVIIDNCNIHIGESNDIVIDLPEGLVLTADSPAIVTVLNHEGQPQQGVHLIVLGEQDYIEKGITDVYGKLTVPNVYEGYTDKDGRVHVNGYTVFVTDEQGSVVNAFVMHDTVNNEIVAALPAEQTISYANRITVMVTREGEPVSNMSVAVTDYTEAGEKGVTDEKGMIVFPALHKDMTDSEGKAIVNGYHVRIADESKPIENAYIEMADGKINVRLPEGAEIAMENRITATITDSGNAPVKDMCVIFTDIAEQTATNLTDENSRATVPPTNIDRTDKDGYAQVTETDKTYSVVVEDTKAKIENAAIEIKDGKISVVLPDEAVLDTANQTTVTVTNKDAQPVKDMSVTVSDKNAKTASKVTDAAGKITVPVKTSTGGGSSRPSGSSGGGGGSYSSFPSVNVKVTDKDGKNVSVTKSTDSKGNVTITLPAGKVIDSDHYYTVTLTDGKGLAKVGAMVTLKDRKNGTATGTTDQNGTLTLPATEHKAYIVGYPDGTFRPEGNMSRAEAAAIFARLIAAEKKEKISGKAAFSDVLGKEWYTDYIGYVSKYGIIKGYADKTFRPNDTITRAEYVTMAVRFHSLFHTVETAAEAAKYTDVSGRHWAAKDISFATAAKWLNGYADGSFRPDALITRAEVVAVTNRAMGRSADNAFIANNSTALNRFIDMKNAHWAYSDAAEAANDHMAVTGTKAEIWVK